MAPYEPPESALGERPPRIILDANENPFGPAPAVARALAEFGRFHRYPDPDQKQLRRLLGDYLGVPHDAIMAGNGSDELIDLLCRIYLEPGDEIIDCTPTFGMYRFSAELCGARVVEAPRDQGWRVTAEAVQAVLSPRTRIIFAATPNNPTGNQVDQDVIEALLDSGCVVVVDEAYVEFASAPSLAHKVLRHQNLVVLRTFSKWAGLAGLRVGYGVFPDGIARHLWKVKPPFSVNLAAEAAVEASLADLPLLQERVRAIVRERDRLAEGLAEVPELTVWSSQANFVLVTGARGLKGRLAADGIAVRTYSHPRLSDAVRISVGLPAENDELLASAQSWGRSLHGR
jgi:histidinol-phosphate aminotransferase